MPTGSNIKPTTPMGLELFLKMLRYISPPMKPIPSSVAIMPTCNFDSIFSFSSFFLGEIFSMSSSTSISGFFSIAAKMISVRLLVSFIFWRTPSKMATMGRMHPQAIGTKISAKCSIILFCFYCYTSVSLNRFIYKTVWESKR